MIAAKEKKKFNDSLNLSQLRLLVFRNFMDITMEYLLLKFASHMSNDIFINFCINYFYIN